MTATEVWQNDRHDVSWRVMSGGVVVNLTGTTVRVLAESLESGVTTVLANSFASGIVTHALDGTLPVGRYDLVIEVTLNGKPVTYPDAGHGPVRLTVREALETV